MKRFFSRVYNKKEDFLKSNIIVLLFVLAHAVFCLLLHDTTLGDGLILTCLTIAMVYFLIRFYGVPFDVFLGLAFLSCFAGFYIGTEGAKLLDRTIPDLGIWANVITTSVTTEILGLTIILLVRKNWRLEKKK